MALIEPGFEIAVQRIEFAALDARIKLVAAGRVEQAVRHIGKDRIIGTRVDSPHQVVIVRLPCAVIGSRQHHPFGDRTLGIGSDPGVFSQRTVEASRTLHGLRDGDGARRAFGQTDDSPALLARRDPCLHFDAAPDFALLQDETGDQFAAGHGRGQLDVGHAVVAPHVPARERTALPGKCPLLHSIDRFGAFIGRGKLEFSGQAHAHRAPLAIRQAQRKHRAGAAVRDQAAFVPHQFNPRRRLREMDIATEFSGDFAFRAKNGGGQTGRCPVQWNAPPGRDGETSARGLPGSIESDRINCAPVGFQFHVLIGAVADHHTNGGGTRVVVNRREQEIGRAVS